MTYFELSASPKSEAPANPLQKFRDALIKLKRTSGLFVEDNRAAIEFLGARLFRAKVFLPTTRAKPLKTRDPILSLSKDEAKISPQAARSSIS